MFTFTLQYSELMAIAKKLAHSVSTEETRYYLNGFFMHKANDGTHYAVSTNGHCLTRMTINPAYSEGNFPAVIIPTTAIKQIESIKPEKSLRDKAIVTIKLDADKFTYAIEYGMQSLGGRLIYGNYPDYNRVIPDYSKHTGEYGATGLSSVYLAGILEAASYSPADFKKSVTPVRILVHDQHPAIVQESRDPSVLYIIMPIRVAIPEHKLPPKTDSEAVDALDYLLTQTVDQDLKHGIALSEGEEDARKKAIAIIGSRRQAA